MPCHSEYMEPTELEKEHRRLLFIQRELSTGRKCPDNISKFADGNSCKVYGNSDKSLVDQLTREVCSSLKKLHEDVIHKMSLNLQLWWANHQEEDRKREKIERKDKERAFKTKQALNKLTSEEKKLLNL